MKIDNMAVLVIDFDGTIVTEEYPKLGKIKPFAKDVINRLREEGHYVIINSCRENEHKEAAERFLIRNDIGYDAFNENLTHLILKYNNDCRKIGGI